MNLFNKIAAHFKIHKNWYIIGIVTGVVSGIILIAVENIFSNRKPIISINGQSVAIKKEPENIYTFEYWKTQKRSNFLFLFPQDPIYYYKLNIGNGSKKDIKLIYVTIDFPNKISQIWTSINMEGHKKSNTDTLCGTASNIKVLTGVTLTVAVCAKYKPDINKIKIQLSSNEGEFKYVNPSEYHSKYIAKK